MLRLTWHKQFSTALAALLLCVLFTTAFATPTVLPSVIEAESNSTHNSTNNYNCPEDCHCVLPPTHHQLGHTHKPFLHAKCSSLKGLTSEAPLTADLPIHSIDLSYLSLSRLSHSLVKLHDLTSIDLSHNELHEIGHMGRNIKKLNLKHNRITSSKLYKLPQHVQVLNLQHNDITNLPLEFTQLTQLQTLELSHNPINCSCETLEVRNWLQERHVFMENAVKCTYPAEMKDKPWLQVKQATVCAKEKQLASSLYIDENENELMLGDQPAVEGSGDVDDDEELGKAFLPIEHKSNTAGTHSEYRLSDDVEGSGDLSELSIPLKVSTENAQDDEATTERVTELDEDEDGSGSGGGLLIIPELTRHDDHSPLDDFDAPVTMLSPHGDDDSMNDNKPVEQPAPEVTPSPAIFGNGMGIFDPANEASTTDGPVQEEAIVPVVHHNVESNGVPTGDGTAEVIGPAGATDAPGKDAAIMQAKVGEESDSNATYFLLGVIGLIVVGLILFVGIKRCKSQRNARHDAENPRQTELLDMDKKNLGKPLNKEHAPLIGEKSKSDMAKPINGAGKRAHDGADAKDGSAQQQPLLKNGNSNGSAPKDAVDEPHLERTEAPAGTQQLAPHEYYPITPRYPTPKSPRASKYAQYPQGEQNNNNESPNANDAYLPSSPKSGRYSPVYSPETGRVKIKLTETPKPKTPMLVTRSKSNAGEIITTPVHMGVGAMNGTAATAVHTGLNGHSTDHY